MKNQSTASTSRSSQGQLDSDISKLYQHFLAGDISSLEFSELMDELICVDALIEASIEEPVLCHAA